MSHQLVSIRKKILDKVMKANLNITKKEDVEYLHKMLNQVVNKKLLDSHNPEQIISVMAKVIVDKLREKIEEDEQYVDMRDYMIGTLDEEKRIEERQPIKQDTPDITIAEIVNAITGKVDKGFYRPQFVSNTILLDTYGFTFPELVSKTLAFNLTMKNNGFPGDIIIKKPFSNIIRLRILPFRIPHYAVFAPEQVRSPILSSTDDYFVGSYMHTITPATRTIGIYIKELLDSVNSGVKLDTGTTTEFNPTNNSFRQIPIPYVTLAHNLLAECEYENTTYDGIYQCMTTKVTPKNDGYINLPNGVDKLDSLTISLNDTLTDIYLPSPVIQCTSFTAQSFFQILVSTVENGAAFMPVGIPQRAYISGFNLDTDNIDESKLSGVTKTEFVNTYLIQYLNTRGMYVTVMRYNDSVNQIVVNVVPPPFYTGSIFSTGTFNINIISRRVLIPIQIDQLRKEISETTE